MNASNEFSTKLKSVTKPVDDGLETPEELIAIVLEYLIQPIRTIKRRVINY